MGRVSRTESAARTRERLLDAAAEVFAEKGFAGASIDEIAERAGHTKGAVYSNFANKDDLFLALIDSHLTVKPVDHLDVTTAELGDPETLQRELRPTDVMPTHGDRTTFLLFSEFRLYALRNPEVGRRLADRDRSALAALEARVEGLLGRMGLTLPLPAVRLAALLQCLGAGLEFFHHLDPDGPTKSSLTDALDITLAATDTTDAPGARWPGTGGAA